MSVTLTFSVLSEHAGTVREIEDLSITRSAMTIYKDDVLADHSTSTHQGAVAERHRLTPLSIGAALRGEGSRYRYHCDRSAIRNTAREHN